MPKIALLNALGDIAILGLSSLPATAETLVRSTTITEEAVRSDPPNADVVLGEQPVYTDEWMSEEYADRYGRTIEAENEPFRVPPTPVVEDHDEE